MKLAGTKYTLGREFEVRNSSEIGIADASSVRTYANLVNGTDWYPALQAAFNAGGRIEFEPGVTYTVSQAPVVNVSNTEIIGNGATIDGSAIAAGASLDSVYGLKIEGSIGATIVTVTSDIAEGSVSVACESTATLAAGDLVLLYSTTEKFPTGTSASNLRGAVHRVRSVDSSTAITLHEGSFFAFTAATTRVRKISPVVGVKVRGLKVRMGGVNKCHAGIRVLYAQSCEIDGSEISDTEDIGVLFGYTLGGGVYRSIIYNCTSPGDGSSGVVGNTGYGICAGAATRGMAIDNNDLRNCRHSVAGGGTYPSIGARVIRNRVDGNRAASYSATYALDCHEDCIGWVFDGNEVYGSNASTGSSGILIRGSKTRVTNNIVTGAQQHGIYVRNYDSTTFSEDTIVSGNVVTAARLDGIVVYGTSTSLQKDVTISKNTVTGCGGDGIVLYGTEGATVDGNVIKAPSVSNKSGVRLIGTADTEGNRCVDVTISDNTIKDATLYGVRAEYANGLVVKGNKISGSSNEPIYCASCIDVAITANRTRVAGATRGGILLSATTDAAVSGNVLRHIGTPSSVLASGIVLSGATEDVVATGNRADGFQNGIHSVSPANHISAVGNRFRGCTSSVSLAASADVVNADNV